MKALTATLPEFVANIRPEKIPERCLFGARMGMCKRQASRFPKRHTNCLTEHNRLFKCWTFSQVSVGYWHLRTFAENDPIYTFGVSGHQDSTPYQKKTFPLRTDWFLFRHLSLSKCGLTFQAQHGA
jgi:hypothetical protein